MLYLRPRRTYCQKLSGKLLSASVTGPDGGTNMDKMNNDPNLIGKATETVVYMDNIRNNSTFRHGLLHQHFRKVLLSAEFESSPFETHLRYT